MKDKHKQAMKGILIAPLIPSAIVIIASLLYRDLGGGIWIITIALPASYLTGIIIGLPAYMLLEKIDKTGFLHYLLAGLLGSFVPIFFLPLYPFLSVYGTESVLSEMTSGVYQIGAIMMFFGAAVACSFWFIVRPDKAPMV